MQNIGNILRSLRRRSDLTQAELARMANVTKQTICNYEKGRRVPDYETLETLADVLNVPMGFFLSDEEQAEELSKHSAPQADKPEPPPVIPGLQTMPYTPPQAMIRVIGSVRCGEGGLAFEEDLGAEPANVPNPQEYFWLRAEGDSMEPRICDGDLVLVHQQETVENGAIAVAIVDDEEGTLKKVFISNDTIALVPYNSESHPTRTFFGKDTRRVRIVGKVIESKRKY